MEEIIVMETEGGIWPGYIGKISVLCLAKEINKIFYTKNSKNVGCIQYLKMKNQLDILIELQSALSICDVETI